MWHINVNGVLGAVNLEKEPKTSLDTVFESDEVLEIGMVPTIIDGKEVWTTPSRTEEQTLVAREAAYKSRSDKYFLEAIRKDVEGKTEEASDARSLGLAEVALIKEEFPL